MAGWDSNWATTQARGKLPRNVCTQIANAFEERRGNVPPSSLLVPPTIGQRLGRPVAAYDYTWFDAVQSLITLAFDEYANHTLGDDYSGLSSFPKWTQTTMLTAIGDSVRIPAPTHWDGSKYVLDPLLVSAWAYQQYKMINMLRWRLVDFTSFGLIDNRLQYWYLPQDSSQGYTKSGLSGWTTWAGIKSHINGLSWSAPGATVLYPGLGADAQIDKSGASYSTTGAGAGILAKNTQSYSRDGDHSPTVDFYLQSRKLMASKGQFMTSDNFSAVGKIYRFAVMDEDDATISFTAPLDGFLDLSELIEPSVNGSYSSLFAVGAVIKMDGDYGFEYRDW